MSNNTQQADFSRQTRLDGFGEEGQDRLANSRILILGAGGLGSVAIPYLAAAGVGHLTIVDYDSIELSNIHRQILFTYNDLEQPKADIAAKFAQLRTPYGTIHSISRKLSEIELLDEVKRHDITLDCTDDRLASYILNDCALLAKKPIIFGNASRFDGQLFTMMPDKNSYDHAPCWRCLWPMSELPPTTCDILGVVGPVPGIIGSTQALEALKYIVGFPVVHSKLIRYSFLSLQQSQFKVQRCSDCKHDLTIADFHTRYLNNYLYEKTIEEAIQSGFKLLYITSIPEAQPAEVEDKIKSAFPNVNAKTINSVDLYDLLEIPSTYINRTCNYLLLCSHGFRAKYATLALREEGFSNTFAYIKDIR